MSASFVDYPFTTPAGVRDRPFQAQYERTDTRTTAGSQTTLPTKAGPIYRDSYGRSRREIYTIRESGRTEPQILIHDPVNQLGFFLDPDSKTAFTMPMPSLSSDEGQSLAPVLEDFANSGTYLGLRTIEGLICRGFHLEQPSGGTIEYWVSEDLLEVVLAKSVSGEEESTLRLFNIRRVEPDGKLFSVPENYKTAAIE